MHKLYRSLLAGCFLLLASSVLGQTSLHYWDFNTGVSGTPWGTPIPATQTIGSGSLSHPYGSNTDAFAGSTIDAPGFTSPTAGASFSVVGTATNNQAFILTVPTTGYQDVKFTYATRGTATGHTTHTIDYSTDGINYTNIATITGRNVTTYSLQTVDFAAIGAADNNPDFKIRVTVSGATATAGNNRFDNLRLSGAALSGGTNTLTTSGTSNGAEGGANGSFTLGFSPATSALTTVDYAFTGTATFSTDYTVSFSAGTPSGSGSSGTLTIPSGVSSITVTVTPVDDASVESSETVTLTLSNPSGGYSLSPASANISITDNDVAPPSTINYTGNQCENFNTLATSGTSSTLPSGWRFAESGSNANTSYTASDGTANSGDTYSFGTTSSTERAFGTIRSGSNVSTIGAAINNNTGATITSLNIAFTGEQWRLGATGRSDRLDFQYSLDATSLTNGTWTDVDGLDFIAPVSSGTVGLLDGNASGNKTNINYTINGLSIPAGATFYIRWLDSDASGADDGLAVDDVCLTPGCTPPTNQATSLNFTPGLQSISGSFTAAASGSTNADAYLVLISTSATLTEQPLTGNTYAVDDVVGNARVVSVNGSTTFTANGLTPGTTYYFFVYSSVAASNCYNLSSPLTASVSTTTPPPCTAPSTQASSLNASNITGTSMDISYVRGNGDNVLVVARTGASVNANPINSVNYPTGTEIGSGNFVVYNGPAASFTHSGLTQNTTYYYAVYEYNSADYCYNQSPLTGNFTTACTTPVNVSALSSGAASGQVTLTWTNPSGSCFDEVIVVASTAPIAGAGGDYTGTANSTYTSGEQVVYRGTGTNVTVTGLTNGTTYYFKVFTRKGLNYSSGVQVNATPFDPSAGYTYLFGNIHAHSSYSDGNKDDLSKTPDDDYAFARDALCMDFLGISEHNHTGAGMNYPDYKLGYNEANSMNLVPGPTGNSIVTLWGMEWGVISGGGHVLVYGFDADLIGWEAGNYDIFVAKNDYASLWNVINARPGGLATLAHPNSSDYGSIASTYNAAADNAIVGVAVESGPAFSTSKTYNDFPSSLAFLSYYRTMLARGYHLAPQMDQDNHNLTFGTANTNRMVVMATAKTREALMQAIRANRYYASQDCNMKIDFTRGSSTMGSNVTGAGVPALSMTVTDPDGEGVSTIQVYGAQAGSGITTTTPIKTYTATSTFTFTSSDAENVQPNNTTWYYYAIVTQEDGNRAVTAPIWYSRNDAVLPVTLTNFNASHNQRNNTVLLTWTTSQETNSREFVIEHSTDGATWTAIGNVNAAGSSLHNRQYQYTHLAPQKGNNLYRLKQMDLDNSFKYSPVASVQIGKVIAQLYSVYPNPVKGYTYVNSTSATLESINLRLIDNNGREVMSKVYQVSKTTPARVDLAQVAAGTYFVQIVSDGKVSTEKIVIY